MAKVKGNARAAQRQNQINEFEAGAGRLRNRPAGFTAGAQRIVANARRLGPDRTSTFNVSSARRRLRKRPDAGAFTMALNQVQENERRRARRIR